MARQPYKNPLAAARAVHRHMDGLFVTPYAGIAASPSKRLFSQHRVDPKAGHFIAVPCVNDRVAREAEAILLANGYRGGSGGGSRDSRWLYAYDTTFYTREDR